VLHPCPRVARSVFSILSLAKMSHPQTGCFATQRAEFAIRYLDGYCVIYQNVTLLSWALTKNVQVCRWVFSTYFADHELMQMNTTNMLLSKFKAKSHIHTIFRRTFLQKHWYLTLWGREQDNQTIRILKEISLALKHTFGNSSHCFHGTLQLLLSHWG